MSLASLRRHEGLAPALIAAALLLRALVPAGWMPVAQAGGFVLELCSGHVPGGDPQQLRAARELLDSVTAGAAGKKAPPDGADTGDQPCIFAGPSPAAPPAALPEPIVPAPEQAEIQPLALEAAIGRGLPAPPPPATGPPALT